jgi:hypothetical protein
MESQREKEILKFLQEKGLVSAKDFLWMPKWKAMIPTEEAREKIKALTKEDLEWLEKEGLEIL